MEEKDNLSPFEQQLQRAVEAMKNESLTEAAGIIDKLLETVDSSYNRIFLLYFYRGRIAHKQDQLDMAKKYYRQSIDANGDYALAYNNLGNILKQSMEFEEAETIFKQAQVVQADYFAPYYNLARMYMQVKRFSAAREQFEIALSLSPEETDILAQLAEVYWELILSGEDAKPFQKLTEYPQHCQKWLYQLGVIFYQRGRLAPAAQCYELLIEINPSNGEAYNALGVIYYLLGRSEKDVIDCYQKALHYQADEATVQNNMGNAYKNWGKIDQAIEAYQQSIKLDSNSELPFYNLGFAYAEKKDYPAAIEAYQKAFEINPKYSDNLALLLNALQHTADWEAIEKLLPKLVAVTEEELAEDRGVGLSPFGALMLPLDKELLKRIAINKAEHSKKNVMQPLSNTKNSVKEKSSEKPIHIGYISADLSIKHPVGLLCQGLFAKHDRKKFTVSGYGLRDFDDPVAKNLIQEFDHFHQLSSLTHQQAAAKIHEDQVDVLIDLGGFTKFSRPQILAYQPAPVQCQYMGYPGTMGGLVDYYITHHRAVPKSLESYFIEKLIFLSTPYAINAEPLPTLTKTRADYGLPEDGFVFCCFNTVQRIESKVFSAWMRILQQVPGSVLWLHFENDTMVSHLRHAATAQGVDATRLVFSQNEAITENYRIRLADLWLDTWMLSGGTAGVLCAQAGLPVLTLAGDTPQSRTGAAIVDVMAADDLIVENTEDYEKKAIEIASNPRKLKSLKKALEKMQNKSPLFKQADFVQELESAYEKVWQLHASTKTEKSVS